MRVLGIDPGLGVTGYGCLEISSGSCSGDEGLTLLEAGCIRLPRSGSSIPDRLVELERDLEDVLARVEPDSVCVESIFSHYRHPRTAVTMAHARGVILLAAARRGIGIVELPPAEVKKALTGSGRASKSQVQRSVMMALRLASPPEPLDVSDALAIAICGTRRIRNPIAADLSPRRSSASVEDARRRGLSRLVECQPKPASHLEPRC